MFYSVKSELRQKITLKPFKKVKKLLSSSSNATSSADNDEVDATKNLLSNLYLERGHAYEQIEKYANAVDDYKRALKIGGNDTKVSMALAAGQSYIFKKTSNAKTSKRRDRKIMTETHYRLYHARD